MFCLYYFIFYCAGLSTDCPWTVRRTINGLIQAVAHSYFLATNNSKRLKTVANFSKAEIRKALQFLAFQAISQRLITAKMPLVRMRSPVQIWLAAPKPLKPSGFGGFLFISSTFCEKTFVFLFLKNSVGAHPFSPIFDEGIVSHQKQRKKGAFQILAVDICRRM